MIKAIISSVMIIWFLLNSIVLNAGEIDSIINSLLKKKQARTEKEIATRIKGLHQILVDIRKSGSYEKTEDSFYIFQDILLKENRASAIRLGLDWLYYNANMAQIFCAHPAEEMYLTVGELFVKNPQLLKEIYLDKKQLNRNEIVRAITMLIESDYFYWTDKWPDFYEIKKVLEGLPLLDLERSEVDSSIKFCLKQKHWRENLISPPLPKDQ